MMLIFETERLIVRPYTQNDQEIFFLLNSNAEVVRYIRPAKNREECNQFLLEVIAAFKANPLFGRWAVHEKISNTFVGSFAVIPVEQTEFMQMGYALLPAFWGKGFATELTKKGLEYVFTQTPLEIIYGYTEKPNTASQQVLLKTGFMYTGEKLEKEKILVEFVLEKKNYGLNK